MGFFAFAGNGTCGADASTKCATHALGGVDGKGNELRADEGGTFFISDVVEVFVFEISQSGEDGVGGSLSEAAE